jgi:hypothetical protein
MYDVVFFTKSQNKHENLLFYHHNKLVEISKLLFDILEDNRFFLDYLLLTNFPGIVENFTSEEVIVNYDEIIKYIKNNVKNENTLKEFFLHLVKQSDLISGNDVENSYQFREEFNYLFK